MLVEEELAEFSPQKGTLLTIGVFDGVHLGHRYLLSQLMERAKGQDLLAGVVTFRQHPLEVLSPQTELPYLTDVAEKVELLKREGVDIVIPLSFTPELAQLSAGEFVALLKKYLRMRGLLIGPDFALGRRREGDADTLRALGGKMGFSVTAIPPVRVNGEVVSSTDVRNALAEGDMKRVTRLLGRTFSLQGRVIGGAGRGVELGFPTTNLEIDPKRALPVEGVYASWTYLDDRSYHSMTYIGRRPTFGSGERTVETYILDYHGHLYGQELKIDIVERLRGDKRFDTAEELKKQIAEDVKRGKAILDCQVKK